MPEKAHHKQGDLTTTPAKMDMRRKTGRPTGVGPHHSKPRRRGRDHFTRPEPGVSPARTGRVSRPNRAASVGSRKTAVAAATTTGRHGRERSRSPPRSRHYAHGSEAPLDILGGALRTIRLVGLRVVGHGHPNLENRAAVLTFIVVSGHDPSPRFAVDESVTG